jgi:hypothetical protein
MSSYEVNTREWGIEEIQRRQLIWFGHVNQRRRRRRRRRRRKRRRKTAENCDDMEPKREKKNDKIYGSIGVLQMKFTKAVIGKTEKITTRINK